MGTWGTAILADDLAQEVHDEYLRQFNAGDEAKAIAARLTRDYAAEITDEDDGPVFWFALAKAQWETGTLESEVFDRVSEVVTLERGLARWREAGPRQLARRQSVLRTFLEQVSKPHPKPKKRRKAIVRRAPFAPGDCISLNLGGGQFGAAVILAAQNGPDASGANLVGVLRYNASSPPSAAVFEKRDWLQLTHHGQKRRAWLCWVLPNRFRQLASKIQRIATTTLRPDDPSNANCYCAWELVAEQVLLQAKWDSGDRT